MNSSFETRWLFLCLCVLTLLPVFAGSICAAPASANFLHTSSFMDWASDRAHMVQLSLVIVALGIAVMWWYR